MNTEQQILQNQMETLKEIGEIKEDIGIIKGTIEQLIPRVDKLEKVIKTFISKGSITIIILISAGVFVPMGILIAKLVWG
ncbi:unnamed protein product [marine sediment metagenome]|uniref:Uncharacterized protein n=1 Tax=marine sediment metagenome TaxID=412755 RepID=X0V7U0_9ZZZZ